jgi:hypothetical protein
MNLITGKKCFKAIKYRAVKIQMRFPGGEANLYTKP